jgi:radical SAM protein with 4Fe4S-binding SPASM domain
LAEELEISSIDFNPITVHRHIPEIQNEALGPRVANWRETLKICNVEAEAKGVSIDTSRLQHVLRGSSPKEVYREIYPCPEPFRFMVIRANGDIFPCCNWDVNRPMANIAASKETSVTDLEKIWQSPKWRALREDIILENYPEECNKCMANFTRPFKD